MSDYCTLADIKAHIPESIYATTTDYDASISALIPVASRLIDKEVGRWDNFFYPSTADETRFYDGVPGDTLQIDEFVSITSVSVSEGGSVTSSDYTTLAATDFYNYPYNAANQARPYKSLVLDLINGTNYVWYEFRKAVKVVGIFGWSATPPADIAQACAIQTVRWVMRSKQMYQDTGADGQMGPMVFKGGDTLDPDIVKLLRGYKMELQP